MCGIAPWSCATATPEQKEDSSVVLGEVLKGENRGFSVFKLVSMEE